MKKRIAIDMDEVIVQVLPKFLDLYEVKYGRRPDESEFYGKKLYQIPGAMDLRSALFEKGFFRDLPLMPDAKEVLKELAENYEIFIVTAAMEFRNCLEDKYDWLIQELPFIHWKNFVFCGNKSIIRADYMIDDHVFNLEGFTGKGLLYTASHNVHEGRFERVNNWQEIRSFFKKALLNQD